MAAEPEFYLSDESGSAGPLSAEALREELRSRSDGVKIRVASSSTWLPAFAWDAAGDHSPPPAPPPLPPGGPGTTLPPALADLKPKVREKLLWFLSDSDGLRGPLTGESIRAGVMKGKIPLTAGLCMVASQEWVRAGFVFPRANEGTTAIRARPFATFPCPFCVEPVVVGERVCDACGERLTRRTALGVIRAAGVGVAVYAAVVGLGVVAAGRFADRLASAPGSAAAPGAPLLSLASAPAPAPAPPTARPISAAPAALAAGGHLAGEVVGKMDVSPDAVDVLSLPHDRIAVARKAAVEVLDAKSGALAFTAADLPAIRALYPVGEAVYGLGASRIAVIDPSSVRALKWIDVGSAPGGVAVSGGAAGSAVALVPLAADQSVAVIDAVRHAEIERFHFDERVTVVGVDDRAGLAALATSDLRGPRPGEDAVLLFDPSRLAAGQPLRRVYVGEAPVAVTVSSSGSLVAAALLTSASIARIDLGAADKAGAPSGALSVTRHKTCDEPIFVRFITASGLILVACRGGRAVVLHDGATLAEVGRLDLGGPAIGLDVAPDGLQALVVVGAPAASVGVIDLVRKSLSRLSISDEIASARYGPGGVTGTAFAPRAHRVWVLR